MRRRLACRLARPGIFLWISSVIFLSGMRGAEAVQWRRLELVVHVHSGFSTGGLTAGQIIDEAQTAGLDGVLFTDSLLRRWEYGLWPLRGWLKKTVEQPSVLKTGAAGYLETIAALNSPDKPLAVAGVEAAPFYYWRRSPLDKKGGEICDWNKHLLVFGLDAAGLEKLPLEKWDAYHGGQGAAPYQAFIDAAAQQGGLVFWAHPFIKHANTHGGIADFTESYPYLLEATEGYQGFAITYLGYLTEVEAGGLWDRLLVAYCRGLRKKPAWILGESDWRAPDERPLDRVVTEAFASERTPQAVLQAIGEGRAWAAIYAGRAAPRLEAFELLETASNRVAISGDYMSVEGAFSIRIRVSRGMGASGKLRLALVKDGSVVAEEETAEQAISRQWQANSPAGISYYRLIVEDPAGVIYTNPVFIRPRQRSG